MLVKIQQIRGREHSSKGYTNLYGSIVYTRVYSEGYTNLYVSIVYTRVNSERYTAVGRVVYVLHQTVVNLPELKLVLLSHSS